MIKNGGIGFIYAVLCGLNGRTFITHALEHSWWAAADWILFIWMGLFAMVHLYRFKVVWRWRTRHVR